MASKINMPDLGESVEEGTIVRWIKAEGDAVVAGEGLLEIDTDKVTTEIESPVDGILLKIIAGVDEIVKVGALLGLVGDVNETITVDNESHPLAEQIQEKPARTVVPKTPQTLQPPATKPEA